MQVQGRPVLILRTVNKKFGNTRLLFVLDCYVEEIQCIIDKRDQVCPVLRERRCFCKDDQPPSAKEVRLTIPPVLTTT